MIKPELVQKMAAQGPQALHRIKLTCLARIK